MKDGTVYYMLRVQYTTGYGTPQESTGEEVAPDPNTLDNSFVVFVMNYKPEVKREICEPTDITESKATVSQHLFPVLKLLDFLLPVPNLSCQFLAGCLS